MVTLVICWPIFIENSWPILTYHTYREGSRPPQCRHVWKTWYPTAYLPFWDMGPSRTHKLNFMTATYQKGNICVYIYTMTLGKCKTNFNKMYISTLFSLLPDLFCFFGNSEALNTSRPQAKLCFNVEGWVLRLSVHLTLMHFCKQSSFFSSFSLLLSARGSISWHTHCEQRAVNPRGASANESWQKQ